jgi:hypothetical protein
LTPEEAKQQLRYVAARLGIGPWVRRQPLGAVMTGVVSGFLLGRIPRRSISRLSHTRVAKRMFDRLV